MAVGRGKGHGTTSVPDNSSVSNTVSTRDEELFPCGTCSVNVGTEDSMEYELCQVWTHAAQKCPGVTYRALKTIVDFSKFGATRVYHLLPEQKCKQTIWVRQEQ